MASSFIVISYQDLVVLDRTKVLEHEKLVKFNHDFLNRKKHKFQRAYGALKESL